MKRQSCFVRFLSLLLSAALLLEMLPATVSAAGQLLPQDADYKSFSMENLNNGEWVSYGKYSKKETMFFTPVDLTGGRTWTKLTFTIELSQYVSLELYKLKGKYVDENLTSKIDEASQNLLYTALPLTYKPRSAVERVPEDPTDPESPLKPITREDLLEDFLDGEAIGYLYGVPIEDHIYSTEDGISDIYEAAHIGANSLSNEDWQTLLTNATGPNANKVSAKELYAFGVTSAKYFPPAPPEPGESEAPVAAYTRDNDIAPQASTDDTKIQNYFIWDGSVQKSDGTMVTHLDEGYYVIVMTPHADANCQFNSFLGFENRGTAVTEFNAANYSEPELTVEQYARAVDPVDLMTGSFIWNYTDFSLYGKHDLPFTRYYSSIDGDRNYGLGRGWTTEYTADLRLETFFAQATLPGSKKLNFSIKFDGSYEPDGDYTFAWNGNGYTLTNTYTKDVYLFDPDGNVQQLIHPDGNIIHYSYTGGKLTSISNAAGSFALSYDDQGNVASVTDSEGRAITLSYDGYYLTSVKNPDGDSLRYTYDANGYAATVENFKGQVYVHNTYNADGQVTHQYAADIGTFDFTYDRTNRHNTCTGTDGYLLELRYDDKGRITENINASGAARFTWNDDNQLTSETDRNGNTTCYAHDAAGNVSQITYPDGATEKMEYNAIRKVTKRTDRNGVATSYTYDQSGNVTSATDGRGNTTAYAYDAQGNLTSVTDREGNNTVFAYDSIGNRTSMTDAKGNKTTYTYDGQGRLTSQTSPDGSKTEYEYTTAGKLVKITDAAGNTQTYTVDGNGFNTSESDWMGNITAYERNTQNQITKITDPLGNAASYSYDERGNLVVATDANGNQTAYGYDAAGRMVSMTDAKGNTWAYTYDNEGRMTAITDPAGGETATAYDRTGRTTSATDAKGAKTDYTYDKAGHTTAIKDALGHSTAMTYDANGNLISRTDRNGETWNYTYDKNDRLTSETDPLGGVTEYAYDELGNVTKAVTPGGAETSSVYDSMGRPVTVTNALGHATGYEYDTLGRTTKVTYADGTSVSYTYNANGQILTATNEEDGVTTYTYDANGQVTSITDPMGGKTTYAYDAMGQVSAVTDPLGFVTTYTYNETNAVATVTDANGGVTSYGYDKLGRIASVTDPEGGVTSYGYDAVGNLTSLTDPEGSTASFTYDLLGRLTKVTDARGNSTTYTYDAEGNQTGEADPMGYSASRTYDALGRLVSETDKNGNTRSYAYDADGRLLTSTDPLGGVTTYTYDALGRVTAVTTPLGSETVYTYDAMGRKTGETDPMGHTTTFTYDALGRVIGVTNKDGTAVSSTYDANGNLLSTTDELGNTVSYTYDANGRQTSVTDALGGVTRYAYDKVGNLISTTDALGGVTAQTFDKLGNLTSTTDAAGNVTAYVYDKDGRCVSITDPNGGVIRAEYDGNGNIVKITDPEGNVTTYAYNARNELASYTDAEGYTFSYTYDGNGNVVSYTDGNGNVTRYVYDALDRAVGRINAQGNSAANTYDADGRLTQAVNEEGAVTAYAYDKDSRLISMTDALGNVTSFTYGAMDQVTKVTDALGNETAYTYDAAGNVKTATNAKGVTTTYTYDANGNLLTVTDAAGTTAYAYDALNRVTSITDRRGNTKNFEYDATGKITKVTDKNGNSTSYTYDGNGNILTTTDALGTVARFEYNANDQLIKMTQTRADSVSDLTEEQATLYEYDGRNLVTKVIQPTGANELYVYDGNGNLVSKTDGDGYVTEYSYNSLDLVSAINYNDAKEVTYQYNKVGQLVRMDDWTGTNTFELDLLGQLKKVTDHKGNVVSYAYDAVGNQTSLTYPDGGVAARTYDAIGELLTITDPEEGVYTYEYDDAGNVTRLTYPNGWIEDYTYDAEGNLTKVVDTDPFVTYNKTSTKYEYGYDAEGNVTREYDRDSGETKRAQTSTYTYDALNRLTHVTETSRGYPTVERSYIYDTLGNMIQEEADECLEYHYHGTTLYESRECCERAEYNGVKRWDYTYDGRGNLVSVDKYMRTTQGMQLVNSEKYVYDETNKLVRGTNEDGEVSLYTYNGLGVRVGRELIVKDNTHGYTDFHKETPSVETGLDKPEVVKESYVVDYTRATLDTLVKEEAGGNTDRWLYGLQALQVKITSEGTDWWGQDTQQDVLTAYAHHDRLGSIVNLSDQYGRTIARADYREYGEIAFFESITVNGGYRRIAPQLVYTNHEWDDVLDLYYAKARFYDPDEKRFLSMDPVKGSITDPQSLVPYVYCVDNPLRYTDPLGKMPSKWLNLVNTAYLSGLIAKNQVFAVVSLLNVVNIATQTVQSLLENMGSSVVVQLKDNIRNIMDFIYEDEETDLYETSNPKAQSIYLSFHETAQVLASKQIYLADPLARWPYLEAKHGLKEIDIKSGNSVWEVKPGYTGEYNYTRSLKKYIGEKRYVPGKDPEEYDTGLWGTKNIPGFSFYAVNAKMFEFDEKTYSMSVAYMGPGKVGYFFFINCETTQNEFAYAKQMVPIVQDVYDAAYDVNLATSGVIIALATFALTVVSPVLGDEAAGVATLADAWATLTSSGLSESALNILRALAAPFGYTL